MREKEQSSGLCRKGIVPSYVAIAEYIQRHIDDKKPLTKSFLIKHFHATPTMVQYCLNGLPSVASNRRGLHLSEGSSVLTLLDEVEATRQRPTVYNYIKPSERKLKGESASGFVKAAVSHGRKV